MRGMLWKVKRETKWSINSQNPWVTIGITKYNLSGKRIINGLMD